MKEIIKEKIIQSQRKELSDIQPRDLILPENTGKIISIIGPRRSGKSSFLFAYLKKQYQEDRISPEQVLFINFEDERLDITDKQLSIILEAYTELYPSVPKEKIYCFFDEIQNIPGWETFIRRIYDEGYTNIFITGSNAKLLSQEIATSLRGRSLSFEILPLSFSEFIRFKSKNILSPYLTAEKAQIQNLFQEYLMWGGFPEIIHFTEEIKVQTLQEYFEVMIFYDIVERYKISDSTLLKTFIKKIIQTSTKEFSINKICNELKSMGFKFDKNILYSFIQYIQNIYFGRVIEKFDFSVKKQYLVKKFYPIDNGFMNALSFSFSRNHGKLLENLVLQHLSRKHSGNIFFIKNGIDVDFIINESECSIIQSCWELTPENKKRELDSLQKAMKKYNATKGICVTANQQQSLEDNIEVLEFWRWAGSF